MELLIYSAAHFFVDGLCAATLYGALNTAEPSALIAVYNTLAFSTQAFTGLVADRLKSEKILTALACLAVVLGFILPINDVARVILVGLGNSFFHVGGGTAALRASGDTSWRLGVFVAPGGVGLVLGVQFPALGAAFAAILAVLALIMPFLREKPAKPVTKSQVKPSVAFFASLALLIAVAVRSYGGFAVSFPWKTTAALAVLASVFVAAGKASGGFLCDKIGAEKLALISLPLAAVLTAFLPHIMPAALLGQLLLNLTMPVTLALLYRLLPSSPGFSFGIAASFLWPGAIAAQSLPLTGAALKTAVIISFLLGVLAIVCAAKILKGGSKNGESHN